MRIVVGDRRLRLFPGDPCGRVVGGKQGRNREIRQRNAGESGASVENNLAMSECVAGA